MLFFQLLTNARALHVAQVIHEQLAIQMIQLVLDADRKQALRFEFERFAVTIQSLD